MRLLFEQECCQLGTQAERLAEVFNLFQRAFDAIESETQKPEFNIPITPLRIVTYTYFQMLQQRC